MKATVIGSFSDLRAFIGKCEELRLQGYEVFPSKEWIEQGMEIIRHHHTLQKDLPEDLLKLLAEREKEYFRNIRESGIIYVFNEKNGKEHIGHATALEIGVALALGKSIEFWREPTDQHFKIIFKRLV
jgi:hypothetical protein